MEKSGRIKLSGSLIFVITVFILIIISTVTCIFFTVKILHHSKSNEVTYGIVFDAGSTHTEMLIFKWPADKSNGYSGTALLQQVIAHERRPGISSLLRNNIKTVIAEYFEVFFRIANETIAESHRSHTTLLLGATAGMRLLQLKNPNGAKRIMFEIRSYFLQQGYLVHENNIRVVTGEEEAIYGWIGANVLLAKIHPRNRKISTAGFLDLGGSSSQIAFLLQDETTQKFKLKLFGHDFSPFAKSFLCLGKEQSRVHYLQRLIWEINETQLTDPCQNKGTIYTINNLKLTLNPCSLGLKYTKWKKVITDLKNYTFKGTGIPELCSKKIESMFFKSSCNDKRCSFNGTSIPAIPEDKKFIAVSAFYYVMKSLGFPRNISEFKSSVTKYCLMTNKEINEMTSAWNAEAHQIAYFKSLCYDGWYTYSLLKHYGFQLDNFDQFIFKKELEEYDAGWAFGFMLNHTNMIPEKHPHFNPTMKMYNRITLAFLSLILLLVLLLMTALIIKVIKYKKVRSFQLCSTKSFL